MDELLYETHVLSMTETIAASLILCYVLHKHGSSDGWSGALNDARDLMGTSSITAEGSRVRLPWLGGGGTINLC